MMLMWYKHVALDSYTIWTFVSGTGGDQSKHWWASGSGERQLRRTISSSVMCCSNALKVGKRRVS
jgi:hypothetical protein